MTLTREGTRLIIWISVFTFLTTLVLGFRLWAIRLLKKRLQIQDVLVSIAYISTCSLSGLACWTITHGLGRRTSDLTATEASLQHQVRTSSPLIVAAAVTSLVGTVGCKLSMLALYSSLFHAYRFMCILIWLSTAFILAYFITFLCLNLTQCQPLSHHWNPAPNDWCRPLQIEDLLLTGLNIFIDTLIAVLPTPVIWTLQMSSRNRWMVSSMFGMGLIVVAIMAWRLQVTANMFKTRNLGHYFTLPVLLVLLELWLSIIIVSIPSLVPFIRHFTSPRLGHNSSPILRRAHYVLSHRSRRRRGPGNVWEMEMDESLTRTAAALGDVEDAGSSTLVNKIPEDETHPGSKVSREDLSRPVSMVG
ncbi:hypothetical protein BO70DRAFT_335139 [Aspergillus heteromorphus CBS 117.55]|uniref:Rhodopsin domain-containing protein n=1 Tax=Aspergillus heteromorphus CBS 117.55 TaxID=1448321 RepID=A0A317WIY0_9EURO|nr:uncharacterized protein BO70DRAFT_335139 [Aspergillus heteromorphus CBS 117.55]PWY85018.1 hypothetical protein BO70DRAFT_335139 [Aspergillus heteromorphus CBS 117.55]